MKPSKLHQSALTKLPLSKVSYDQYLEALGWMEYLPQQGSKGNEDIPDHLLFSDVESKERAVGRANSHDRFLDALLIEESKRFGLSLDSRDPNDKVKPGSPHAQVLRYLATADTVYRRKDSVGNPDQRRACGGSTTTGSPASFATAYFESDLAEILDTGDEDGLRTFYLLFPTQIPSLPSKEIRQAS